MSKFLRTACRLLPAFILLFAITGCRKLDLDLNDGMASVPPGAMTPSMGGDVFPGDIPGADIGGGTGWQDSSQPLDTGVGVGQEPVRWTGAVVYFGYDSAAVGPSEMPKIEQVASHMLSHPNYRVIIEGHCDERGSDEYNRALGQQRAFVVRDLLLSKGIEEGRIETVSYGEEKPVVPNATDEAGHQKNRRAEFLFALMK